jgi:acetolactate synthase small subunit
LVLRIEQNPAQEDIEVLITCPVKNKIVERIASFIKSVDTQIECYSDDIVKLVNVSDIMYYQKIYFRDKAVNMGKVKALGVI